MFLLVAWETTVRSACPEDRVVSSRVAKVPVAAQTLEELPGSVPELQDERPTPIIHNTQLDQYEKTTAGQTSWLSVLPCFLLFISGLFYSLLLDSSNWITVFVLQ